MDAQTAYNALVAIIRDKTQMSGREHEVATEALRTLGSTITALGEKVTALEEAAKAKEEPAATKALKAVPTARTEPLPQ